MFISSGPVEDGEPLGTVFIVNVILWVKMCGNRSTYRAQSLKDIVVLHDQSVISDSL